MATYAIGDVQGCFTQLKELLDLFHFNPKKDTLWFTGDLVNRGQESLQTLRFIKDLKEQAIIVLGNHDLHLLAVATGVAKVTAKDTLDAILQAPDCEELIQWLRGKPLIYQNKQQGYVLTHAGLYPLWSLTEAKQYAREVESVLSGANYKDFLQHLYGDKPLQWSNNLTGWDRLRMISNSFTRMRFCDEQGMLDLNNKGKPGSQATGFYPWFKVPGRKEKKMKIIFGHWASLEGKCDEEDVYALDGGCVWGNYLIALRIEDEQLFKIKAS